MKSKRALIVIIFLSALMVTAFAAFETKPQVRVENKYRYDTRQDNHGLYTARFMAAFNYLNNDKKPVFNIAPFFEDRFNLHRNTWERRELGVEIGKDVFPWLYLGEGLQQVWLKEDYRNYGLYEKHEQFESESRFMLKHSLFKNEKFELNAFAVNEYTYDFRRGAGIRNELCGGLILPIGKNIETDLAWRHIDRIHYYDSDVVETSITLIF
ncbi:hypothetical protein EPO66_01265 [bacterium]|nr:MAG: hypothetical protein EPO66_01265 [bacterium]